MSKEKKPAERRFRAWYTHELFDRSLSDLQKMAKRCGIEFDDPDNPTTEELAEVYKETFSEMSDPWEVTANGECKVEEIEKEVDDEAG